MKISYNWLKKYIDLDPIEHSPKILAEVLPLLGFDIEDYEKLGPPPLKNVVSGQVLDYFQHPEADRLRCCKVTIGNHAETYDIVCGAKNFERGDKVMVALPDAVLPGNFKIKVANLRGQVSEGMLCSAKELLMGEDNEGILILDQDIELGIPINKLLSDGDTVYDLEITPNRVDVLSHIGVARELSARFGLEVRHPKVVSLKGNVTSSNPLINSVEISAVQVCPYYTAINIKGVQVGSSPPWLRNAIKATGQRSINNVVDVINFVLHETGQPLHAFDADKIKGHKLIVRMAEDGERIITLDEVKRTLNTGIAVVADAERPLVVAGLMGSINSEVGKSTSNILLEAAYFSPRSIRSTSRKLNLSSDSSYRFERGVDPEAIANASLRAVDLILKVAGGKVDGEMMTKGSIPIRNTGVIFRPGHLRSFIGFDVNNEEIKSIFESLRLEVSTVENDSATWKVMIPSYRADLQREVDLIEEFIRIYGTDKIPESRVVARGIDCKDHHIYKFNDIVADYLIGQNFNEVFLYSLRNSEETSFFFGRRNYEALALRNPLQSDQSHLRSSLIPGLLDVLKLNNARSNKVTRFFERGHVYRDINGEIVELVSVGFVIVADHLLREWRQRELADFYSVKTISIEVLKIAGAAANKLVFEPIEACKLWQSGHAAFAGDFNKMGYELTCGLLNLSTLKDRWDLSTPVFAGSVLIVPEYFKRKLRRGRHSSISNQPASSKDLALIVRKSVYAGDVLKQVSKITKKVATTFECEDIQIFDIYEGEGLPDGKKSIGLSLSFRSNKRTLLDKEVSFVFEHIQKLIIEKTEYQVRK